MKNHPRIIFYGTPEIAVESLERLIDAGYNVKGVVTAPDRLAGRGLKVHFSPVKEFALRHDLPLFQPSNLKRVVTHSLDHLMERELALWNGRHVWVEISNTFIASENNSIWL